MRVTQKDVDENGAAVTDFLVADDKAGKICRLMPVKDGKPKVRIFRGRVVIKAE